MPIERIATEIAGCFELRPSVRQDSRGSFVKTFHRDWFTEAGMPADWAEQYYSTSSKGVLRGLHCQLPPHDHAKLVYCVAGDVLDAAVDLRVDSPTFGRHVCVTLSAAAGNMIYLDRGLAHGFYVLSDRAILVYNVTTVQAPEHEAGVRWDSAGIPWPDRNPLLSPRNRALPALREFESPFRFAPILDRSPS